MRMWMTLVFLPCWQHLGGEHCETHMCEGCLRLGRSLQGYLDKGFLEPQHLKRRHDELAAEMLRRGKRHHTPMDPIAGPVGHVDQMESYRELFCRCPRCRARVMRFLELGNRINISISRNTTRLSGVRVALAGSALTTAGRQPVSDESPANAETRARWLPPSPRVGLENNRGSVEPLKTGPAAQPRRCEMARKKTTKKSSNGQQKKKAAELQQQFAAKEAARKAKAKAAREAKPTAQDKAEKKAIRDKVSKEEQAGWTKAQAVAARLRRNGVKAKMVDPEEAKARAKERRQFDDKLITAREAIEQAAHNRSNGNGAATALVSLGSMRFQVGGAKYAFAKLYADGVPFDEAVRKMTDGQDPTEEQHRKAKSWWNQFVRKDIPRKGGKAEPVGRAKKKVKLQDIPKAQSIIKQSKKAKKQAEGRKAKGESAERVQVGPITCRVGSGPHWAAQAYMKGMSLQEARRLFKEVFPEKNTFPTNLWAKMKRECPREGGE